MNIITEMQDHIEQLEAQLQAPPCKAVTLIKAEIAD